VTPVAGLMPPSTGHNSPPCAERMAWAAARAFGSRVKKLVGGRAGARATAELRCN
jgi:hypothetical protein